MNSYKLKSKTNMKNKKQTNNILLKIKSHYFLQNVFNYLCKKTSLDIIKYNKQIQKIINIDINDYRKYSESYSSIEIYIELNPIQENKFIFFYMSNTNKKAHYHLYINDDKEETNSQKYDFNKIKYYKIIIDYQITSLHYLFYDCININYIEFRKFVRNNISDMSYMFSGCSSLKKINLSNFNTNNVTNMKCMFRRCSSLEELNISNFNTNNVTDMSYMFVLCSSLKKLNLSNFKTDKVTCMCEMFNGCSTLEELDLSNFNTNNVKTMNYMFNECKSLKKLNLLNFNTSKVYNMSRMFLGCSNLTELNISNISTDNAIIMSSMFSDCKKKLKEEIKKKFNNLRKEAFD